MRLWTIQPLSVWEQLQTHEIVFVEGSKYECEPGENFVFDQYRWLARQLRRRMPAYEGRLPWWFYCEKPDLRRFRHTCNAGERHLRLEMEIPSREAFRMRCWAWQTVLCRDYLALSREEFEEWHSALRAAVPDEDVWPYPRPWDQRLRASWKRLFQPGLPREWPGSDEVGRLFYREGWEAVAEKLRRSNVRQVTEFRGAFDREEALRKLRKRHNR